MNAISSSDFTVRCQFTIEVLPIEEEIYDVIQTLYCMVAGGIAAIKEERLPKPKGPVATVIPGRNSQMDVHVRIIVGEGVRLGEATA